MIDLSMWEAMLCTSFEAWMNHALGNRHTFPWAITTLCGRRTTSTAARATTTGGHCCHA